MIIKRGYGDLNKTYRPCKVSEVMGHDTVKRMIGNALDKQTLPHSMMFTGESGCGKTTFARIIALGLNCKEGITSEPCCKCDYCDATLRLNSLAVLELDSARTGNVDTVRSTLADLPAAPMGGERFKVVIFDEAHNLSGKAEDALLKFLEDVPEHVYLILCTNEPQKLKNVTKNRCKTIQFNRLAPAVIFELLENVSQFEGFSYNKEVLKYIVKESKGVPRQALSFLQQVASEGSWTKDAASLIINAGADVDSIEVFEFCKVLLRNNNFDVVLSKFKEIDNMPVETIRIIMTGFFAGCLKNSKKMSDRMKYSKIIDVISTPYYGPKPEHVLVNNLFKISRVLGGDFNV